MRIDHVQLAIPKGSEDAARAFWVDLVGMTELEKPDLLKPRGGVWLRLGEAELHLGIENPFAAAKKAHPCFGTEHLDSLAETLARAQYPVLWNTDIPGRRRFFSEDPFGNRLEFVEAG